MISLYNATRSIPLTLQENNFHRAKKLFLCNEYLITDHKLPFVYVFSQLYFLFLPLILRCCPWLVSYYLHLSRWQSKSVFQRWRLFICRHSWWNLIHELVCARISITFLSSVNKSHRHDEISSRAFFLDYRLRDRPFDWTHHPLCYFTGHRCIFQDGLPRDAMFFHKVSDFVCGEAAIVFGDDYSWIT